jgi:hypothetical protein
MGNLFEYLTWRGDLNFSQSPLNPVDFVIFSQLAYLPFDGIVPGPGVKEGISIHLALNKLQEKIQLSAAKEFLGFNEEPDFINALSSSNRFRNCHLLGFINQINADLEYQISAICVYTGDGCCSVVFRGTDASLVGWKESFNMCFREVIPAQKEAVKYLEKMAPLLKGNLRIGGHSKGGNLAIYAAAFCEKKIQNRITEIFNFDSPGFCENVIASEGFLAIKDKINFFVPQDSVIGMLFEHGRNYNVIKSSENGLLQHSLFSWEVTHNNMIRVNEVTSGSRYVDKTLRDWINNLANEDREKVIEAMYTILTVSDVKSIHDLEKSFLPTMGRIIKSLGNIDEHTKKLIRKTFVEFLRAASRNFDTLLEQQK